MVDPAERWRYLQQGKKGNGKVAHLLRVTETGGLPLDAQCGLEVFNVHSWRGDSTAYERWQVGQLPKCKDCLHAQQKENPV